MPRRPRSRAARGLLRPRPIPLAVAAMAGFGFPSLELRAEDEASQLPTVTVTGTRRNDSVQSAPINITAVSGEQMHALGYTDFADIVQFLPGLSYLDQGPRAMGLVTARGLNVSNLMSSDGNGNGGGTGLGVYIGDVPIFLNLRLTDIARVESLLGPQGTLYGSGTLGGAVRYLLNKPDPSSTSLAFSERVYGLAHSNGLGLYTDLIGNLPLGRDTALRASFALDHNPGFIDYPNVVRVPGVSNPEPDPNDPAARARNLYRLADADSANGITGRVSLLHRFGDTATATLGYLYQRDAAGGRTVNSQTAFGTGRYESGLRVPEPNQRNSQLLSMEIEADLGFATLTSASGFTRYEEDGQRDQTDLLMSLDANYENFPEFTAYTRETGREDRLSQELRLISKDRGPLNWIGGLFYNLGKSAFQSLEFTPGYPAFLGVDRPDNLEYQAVIDATQSEAAVFGEVSYRLTPDWQLTAGGRYAGYRSKATVGVASPLVDGPFGPDSAGNTLLSRTSGSTRDRQGIFKLNSSYRFDATTLAYATISQGYRLGGLNLYSPCPTPLPPGQNVCVYPDEASYKPDQTLNYELGLKTAWFGGRLTVNGDVYWIDWKDVQVGSVTQVGAVPITVNGSRAVSRGADLSITARLDRHWSLIGNYSYIDARLARDTPGLINSSQSDADGRKGDRLPGSPTHSGALRIAYQTRVLDDWKLETGYGLRAASGVLTKVGGRNFGRELGGYAVHQIDLALGSGPWRIRAYCENLLDHYAETGVRSNTGSLGTIGPNQFTSRRYLQYLLPPRQFGLQYDYRFEF